ncbi:solute:sodium symporter family transporter [Aquimarina sp. AD10]|uniref:Transporter n=1 Tax=Aquimarina aggregata TaxID=1642818 RepID=A0A162X5W4_9FLAO|nr:MULTISPECIES: solute:sodium symporter family transporter [Aquimarina]AXT60506.1 solute:sodium symporter family transporter [Aquimarina sp. AD10]KZS38432.1 transporter [Aquimarina aggregata]RKM96992.1 solute:sodium symporter family transporter [Aquimarina sp. AD10]
MGVISFIGFTLLVAIISYFATRKTNENTSEGYFLGGRSLTATVIAGSLLLTNLSTEQIVGLNGDAYTDGILVMAWETLAAIAMVITAIFLLPRYLKGGISTLPTFLERRFDSTTKALTSGLFLTGYAVVLLPMVLFTGSKAISGMFGIPELLGVSDWVSVWICVWGIGIIGSIYAIFGGLKAVAVSDTINAVGLLIGGLLIPVFGLMAISEDGSVFGGLTKLTTEHPEKFNAVGGPDSSIPFATIFTGMMLVQLFYWGSNQQIIQRALGAKNLAEGQKGLTLAAFIKILGPIIVVLPGIIAYHKYGPNLNTSDVYPKLVADVLPDVWVGFFAAVLFGAILSSFNSALNSCVTLYGVDIYKQFINKEASEKIVVKMGKRFGIILAFFSMIIAPFLVYADSIFGYLQTVNGAYSIPILTVIVIGFLTKKVPAIAAKVGIIFAFTVYVGYIVLANGFGVIDLHMLHMQAITFVLTVIIMLTIGKLKPRESDYVQTYTKEVDVTPWKHVKIVGLVICLVVLSTYFIF